MLWIGLTGGMGSGKSTVSAILEQKGIPRVDADEVAHSVLVNDKTLVQQVVDAFGESILGGDHNIDRSRLGPVVFSDPQKLKTLESLMHPVIQNEVKHRKSQLENQKHSFAVYDVPLLFEKKMESLFDMTVLVYCRPEQQKERVKLRNGWSDEDIQKRLDAQLPIGTKVDRADFVVDNTKDADHLELEVQRLVEFIEKKCKKT